MQHYEATSLDHGQEFENVVVAMVTAGGTLPFQLGLRILTPSEDYLPRSIEGLLNLWLPCNNAAMGLEGRNGLEHPFFFGIMRGLEIPRACVLENLLSSATSGS